jgi:hypothetical protein
LQAAVLAPEVQQARTGAVGQRFARDQLFRQLVIESGNKHRSDYRIGD